MASRTSNRLVEALQDELLVKFCRKFEEGSISGHVLEVGPQFFMVALVDDSIRFNGFLCLRVSDVRHLEAPHKYAAFAEAALRKRSDRRPKKPRVSLANIEELLLSANRAFPLLTIHREKVDPDLCWIGRVLKIGKGRVSFLEIGPDATWDKNPNEYTLAEITRVDFGGDYEKALLLVGGPAPAQQPVEIVRGELTRL
ncbi:MAG: hypothetical protein JWR69_906 [Pedosphaera sp.]|nr:hypothetical protein [Pedosphaera sp.]